MNTTILSHPATDEIHEQAIGDNIVLGTTLGLAKTINEDRLGYSQDQDILRICIADGHWGEGAADMIVKYWLDDTTSFPATREQAVASTEAVQKQLYDAFGNSEMDATRDRTPETAFIVAEIQHNELRIVSYGDCRLLVARQGNVTYQLPTAATWLGAFSHLGLRDRQSVESALLFESLTLLPDDVAMLFTDGIDECIYETPTISLETLARYSTPHGTQEALDKIFKDVFAHGAEDNASLAIISI